MYKIAISGKANSGKDTLAKILLSSFNELQPSCKTKITALADPIKEIIMIMFPRTDRNILFGSSQNRSKEIPNAFKNNKPLTYRRLLQELGTEVGRSYNKNIWLDILDFKAEEAQKSNVELFILTDVRFKNEFEHVKNSGYVTVRVKRGIAQKKSLATKVLKWLHVGHSSEVEQDSIEDSQFDFIVDNNGTLEELEVKIQSILNFLMI